MILKNWRRLTPKANFDYCNLFNTNLFQHWLSTLFQIYLRLLLYILTRLELRSLLGATVSMFPDLDAVFELKFFPLLLLLDWQPFAFLFLPAIPPLDITNKNIISIDFPILQCKMLITVGLKIRPRYCPYHFSCFSLRGIVGSNISLSGCHRWIYV